MQDSSLKPLFVTKLYTWPWAVLLVSLTFASLFFFSSLKFSQTEYWVHGWVFLLAGCGGSFLLGYLLSKSGLSEIHFFSDHVDLYPAKSGGWFRDSNFITYKISEFDRVALSAHTYNVSKSSLTKYIVSFEFIDDPARTIGRTFSSLDKAKNFLSVVQPYAKDVVTKL